MTWPTVFDVSKEAGTAPIAALNLGVPPAKPTCAEQVKP